MQTYFDKHPASAIYLLVDVSSSTGSEAIRSEMQKDYAAVLSAWASTSGLLRGDAIGSDVLNASTTPIRGAIPPPDSIMSDEETHQKKEVAPAVSAARKQFDQVLAGPASNRTEILNALSVAARVLDSGEAKEAKRKVLVIFSDMVEESQLYNFHRDELSDTRISAIIAAERAGGRLPDLKGVRVWKAGASTLNVSDVKQRQIQKFWVQYFAATGAEMNPAHYGASLVDFSLN